MGRVKATYNAEQFVQACFGECVEYARRYVKDNPKEFYDYDDFVAVYRIKEAEEGWPVIIGAGDYFDYDPWYKDDVERFVDIFEESRYGNS